MTRTELYKILKEPNQKIWDNYYKIEKVSNSDTIEFIKDDEELLRESSIRVYMYGKMLFAGGYSLIIKPLEQKFEPLVIPELKKNYRNVFGLMFRDFYKTDYHFDITIETDEDWQTFLDEFDKCLRFYEAEIFPKLTDIKFLAEYVGVPWEDEQNIMVGGSFPISFFKKLAILKWGGQEDFYHIYKKETLKLIKKYAIKKPEKYKTEYMDNFESLVVQLENEPNPFEEKKIS